MALDMPEFVGTAVLDTIGLVIANISPALAAQEPRFSGYRSLGILSSRTGAAGQILAVDQAIKETNAALLSVELPRDTKGWGGHGNYIVIGSKDVSDARACITRALELVSRNAGEVHISNAGHLEFGYTASAGAAVHTAFGAPIGPAFGFLAGSPAAIGLVMADIACKRAEIEVCTYMTPSKGTSHSNEVILAFYGSASAVSDALKTAKNAGLTLLRAMGDEPAAQGSPYI